MIAKKIYTQLTNFTFVTFNGVNQIISEDEIILSIFSKTFIGCHFEFDNVSIDNRRRDSAKNIE